MNSHHQGNPGARQRRRKKPAASLDDQVKQQLNKKIEVRECGKWLEVTQQEAIVKSILAQAIKGKPKALNTVVEFLLREREQAEQQALSERSAEEVSKPRPRHERWCQILRARAAVKNAVRRVLEEHGVQEGVINDLFGIKGISEAEERLRREQAKRISRENGVPSDLLSVLTDMGGLHDYFVRAGVVTETDGDQK